MALPTNHIMHGFVAGDEIIIRSRHQGILEHGILMTDNWIDLTVTDSPSGSTHVRVWCDAIESVELVQRVPAHWPPIPGDVWVDEEDNPYFVTKYVNTDYFVTSYGNSKRIPRPYSDRPAGTSWHLVWRKDVVEHH